MGKAIWLSMSISAVLVTLMAEALLYYAEVDIPMLMRAGLVLGITMITMIFVGALRIISSFEKERPLSGSVRDTLGADRRPADEDKS